MDVIKKESDFRVWVRKIWTENCFEHDSFNEPAWSMSDYFQNHKWFLRQKYKLEKGKKHEGTTTS
jgi:hypothetical protein